MNKKIDKEEMEAKIDRLQKSIYHTIIGSNERFEQAIKVEMEVNELREAYRKQEQVRDMAEDLLEALLMAYDLAVHELGSMKDRLTKSDVFLEKARKAIKEATK